MRALLTEKGYTNIDDLDFEDGMWETDATNANGDRVDVRINPASGDVMAEKLVSDLSENDVKAKLTAEAQNRVFRMATSVDAATLDPHATNALFTFLVVHQIYEGLTWRGDDLRVHPGLAMRWEQVEPTRWRFHLNQARGEILQLDLQAFLGEKVLFQGDDGVKAGAEIRPDTN